jgi:hypothetical protein
MSSEFEHGQTSTCTCTRVTSGGARGERIGESTGSPGAAGSVTVPATTTAIVHPDGTVESHESTYVLASVAYVRVPNSTYQSVARFL